MALGTVLGLASAGAQYYGGIQAEREANRQADIEWATTQEEVRRMDLQQAQLVGETTASMGASGLSMESESYKSYMGDMRSEYSKERAYTLNIGATKARSIRESGSAAKRTAMFGAASTAAASWWSK